MNQQELKNILELHRKWIMNEVDGKRADLSYEDLRDADLSYEDLRDADLRYADLSYANLSYANLSYANLSYADLSYADFRSAKLSYADLRYSNLSYADLRYSNLSYAKLSDSKLISADLRYANLSYADLSDAKLSYADLSDAKLSYAKLSYADLRSIIRDFYAVLSLAKDEVIGLYDSIIRGKIDGKIYEGECACLIGTIAKLRKENYQELGIDLKPESDRLIEKWFLGISKGDNPDNNPISLLTAEWMRDWMKDNGIIIPQ